MGHSDTLRFFFITQNDPFMPVGSRPVLWYQPVQYMKMNLEAAIHCSSTDTVVVGPGVR